MPRVYIVQSWVGACDYSGEQVGNRNGFSVEGRIEERGFTQDIRWDSYKCPQYYHQPRKPKPQATEEQQETISQETLDTDQPIAHNTQQEEKESIFLTLKDGNIFKQIYIKYIKRKEK